MISVGAVFKSTKTGMFVLLGKENKVKSAKTGLFALLIGAENLCMGILCIFVGYME